MDSKETDMVVLLVKRLAGHPSFGWERAAVCAIDCILQDKQLLLHATIAAWQRDINDAEYGRGRCSEHRHGAWVPAIPL